MKNLFKTKNWSFLLNVAIILSAIFFAFYKILDIPPGTQDDVLRSVITAEQVILGLDGGYTSLRQQIAYLLLGGYWSYFFVDIFRSMGVVNGMLIVSRLPSALFFIFGVFSWLRLLRLLRFSDLAIFTFFVILLPSAYYISHSHHIPLIGGYFFYGSVGIYYLCKFFLEEKVKYRDLLIAGLGFVASTYTHVISVFFIASYISVFILLLLLLKPELIRNFVKKNFNSFGIEVCKYILVAILLLISLYPIVDGLTNTDRSLHARSANNITYLLNYDEVGLVKEKLVEKYRSYLHPNTLIFSKDIIEGKQPVYSETFHDIKNPYYNQWVTTNRAPFGFIAIFAYLAFPYVIVQMFRKRSVAHIVAVSLFVSYIAVIFPTNYDNPSIAKVIAPILFIPLSISIFFDDLATSLGSKLVTFALITLLIINAVYNISYLYSNEYRKNEVAKYYVFNYEKAFQEILRSEDLANTRVFVESDDQGTLNLLQFYLGAESLNRTVFGRFKADLISPDEYSFLITKDSSAFHALDDGGIKYKTHTYIDEVTSSQLFLASVKPKKVNLTGPVIIETGQYNCYHEYLYPIRLGEYEYVNEHFRYFNSDIYSSSKCNPSENIKIFDPYSIRLVDGYLFASQIQKDLRTEPLETIVSKADMKHSVSFQTIIVDGTKGKDPIEMSAGVEDAKFLLKVSQLDPRLRSKKGTYLLQFDYEIESFGFLDIFSLDTDTLTAKPINILYQSSDPGFNGKYKTLFFLEKEEEVIFTFILKNLHFNIDKEKHPVKSHINNIQMFYITDENLTDYTYQTQRSKDETSSIKIDKVFPGIYKAFNEGGISTNNLVNFNLPYSSGYVSLQDGVIPTQVNGFVSGFIAVTPMTQSSVYILNLNLFKGVLLLIGHLLTMCMITLARAIRVTDQ